MPYDELSKTIKTKLIGVAYKEVNDKESVRQVILKKMYDEPELVDFVYLYGMTVKVQLDGREFDLGQIKPKYEQIVMKNPTEVKSWQITGGYPITATGHSTRILGHNTNNYNGKLNANYGINIHIKVI